MKLSDATLGNVYLLPNGDVLHMEFYDKVNTGAQYEAIDLSVHGDESAADVAKALRAAADQIEARFTA